MSLPPSLPQIKVHLTLPKPTAEGCIGESMWAACGVECERDWQEDADGPEHFALLLNDSVCVPELQWGTAIRIQMKGKLTPEIVHQSHWTFPG